MKSMMKLIVASAFALMVVVPSAVAQIPEVSVLPVSEPLQIGDTVLQPGTYTIKLVPGFSNRNIVQVTSQDGSTVHATVLSVPHQLGPGEELPNTMFVFYPAEAGQPRALRTWFAADAVSNGGHDIVYEESRARMLARAANARVVSYTDDVAEADFGTTELRVVSPDATIETYRVPATTVQVAEARPMELPATAGRVPMIALLGLLAVVGAVAVRFVR